MLINDIHQSFYNIRSFYLTIVDCEWTDWDEWTSCSKSCGGGKRSTTRAIKIPASNGGKECSGFSELEVVCNTNMCKGSVLGCDILFKSKMPKLI